MQIVDFSFIRALATPRCPFAGEAYREALVAATPDGESMIATSHHADRAYGLMLAEHDHRRSRPWPPPDTRTAALGILDRE